MICLIGNKVKIKVSLPVMTGRTMDERENIMLKDFSIENWILYGTAFIMIFTIGCFVWFQFKMSTEEIYDNHHEVEIQHIDETSDTEHNEIQHIEIHDTEAPDTTGENSTENEVTEDEFSEITKSQLWNIDRGESTVSIQRNLATINSEIKLFSHNI